MEPGRTAWIKEAMVRLSVLLAITAMTAAGATSARTQGPNTAHILTMSGRVSAEHTGELWALTPGQTVNAGQVLVTGPDGYAQLELSDYSIIEVFPNSRMVLRPSRMNWKDLVDIYLGKIRLQIQHLTHEESPYRVTSPTAVISIRGTVLNVEVGPAEDTVVRVETGVVGVRHRLFPGKEVFVETGQTLRVVANVPLAAAKRVSPLVMVGRIARMAGETLARTGIPGRQSGGGGGSSGSAPGPSAGSGGSSGSSAGANEPAPPPGKDGDGTSAPPGDVIKP